MFYHFLNPMLYRDKCFFMILLLTIIKLCEKISVTVLIGRVRLRK